MHLSHTRPVSSDMLIQNARAVFSPGHPNATDVRIAGGRISELGQHLQPQAGERVINASGCVVWPGLVNTHHHLAQSLMRGVPEGLNAGLKDWLTAVPLRLWPKVTPEIMYHAARLGLYDMLRSGVTACADHHYLYHSTVSPELEAVIWQAADELGIRLVLCRGISTIKRHQPGVSDRGLEPETLDQVLARLEDTRQQHHQEQPDAMTKLVVAPNSLIHSCPEHDLKTLATWALQHGMKMHSHLLETGFDEKEAYRRHQVNAIDYADACGWLGADVWYAHLVHSDADAIATLARTGTGVAHCPTSNCRLGSGVAPVTRMAEAGVPVSLAVDGSASSESGSMVQELNLTWLLHRAMHGPEATTLDQVLTWGSRGGAEILGLTDSGLLAPGYCADLVLFDITQPRLAAMHRPVMAPLLGGEPAPVKYSVVAGRLVLEDGHVPGLDPETLTRNVQDCITELLK